MNRITILFAKMLGRDRRQTQRPVDVDRRHENPKEKRPTISQANERFLKSLGDFDETVARVKKNEGKTERVAVNDLQQVVLFPSLQQVCRFRGPDALKVRLCRNERHQDAANTALSICEERKCPLILEAIGVKVPA